MLKLLENDTMRLHTEGMGLCRSLSCSLNDLLSPTLSLSSFSLDAHVQDENKMTLYVSVRDTSQAVITSRAQHYQVATCGDATLKSALENILGGDLTYFDIEGPEPGITWMTPAQKLTGKQLSLRKCAYVVERSREALYSYTNYQGAHPGETTSAIDNQQTFPKRLDYEDDSCNIQSLKVEIDNISIESSSNNATSTKDNVGMGEISMEASLIAHGPSQIHTVESPLSSCRPDNGTTHFNRFISNIKQGNEFSQNLMESVKESVQQKEKKYQSSDEKKRRQLFQGCREKHIYSRSAEEPKINYSISSEMKNNLSRGISFSPSSNTNCPFMNVRQGISANDSGSYPIENIPALSIFETESDSESSQASQHIHASEVKPVNYPTNNESDCQVFTCQHPCNSTRELPSEIPQTVTSPSLTNVPVTVSQLNLLHDNLSASNSEHSENVNQISSQSSKNKMVFEKDAFEGTNNAAKTKQADWKDSDKSLQEIHEARSSQSSSVTTSSTDVHNKPAIYTNTPAIQDQFNRMKELQEELRKLQISMQNSGALVKINDDVTISEKNHNISNLLSNTSSHVNHPFVVEKTNTLEYQDVQTREMLELQRRQQDILTSALLYQSCRPKAQHATGLPEITLISHTPPPSFPSEPIFDGRPRAMSAPNDFTNQVPPQMKHSGGIVAQTSVISDSAVEVQKNRSAHLNMLNRESTRSVPERVSIVKNISHRVSSSSNETNSPAYSRTNPEFFINRGKCGNGLPQNTNMSFGNKKSQLPQNKMSGNSDSNYTVMSPINAQESVTNSDGRYKHSKSNFLQSNNFAHQESSPVSKQNPLNHANTHSDISVQLPQTFELRQVSQHFDPTQQLRDFHENRQSLDDDQYLIASDASSISGASSCVQLTHLQAPPGAAAAGSTSCATVDRLYDELVSDTGTRSRDDPYDRIAPTEAPPPPPRQISIHRNLETIPGWCPDVNSGNIEETMKNFRSEDGNFIVWNSQRLGKYVISVSHMGELHHHLVETTMDHSGNTLCYIFKDGHHSTSLVDLVSHYIQAGIRRPVSMALRGLQRNTSFHHMRLKKPLVVRILRKKHLK